MAEACLHAGLMWLDGEGGPQSDNTARSAIKRGCMLGHPSLSRYLEEGFEVVTVQGA